MARGLTTLLAVCLLAGCASSASPSDERTAALLALHAEAGQAYADEAYGDAAVHYMELVKLRPRDASYWYRLGNALVHTGSFNDAAVAYEQALALDPANGKAWHNLGIARVQQAQAALAEAVKRADAGDDVFQDSLRLSTGLYSLVAPAIDDAPTVPSEAGPDATPGDSR